MYNEVVFIIHALFVGGTALLCLRMGKEALIAFIAVQGILTNLFVIKQTTLCMLTATCSDAFTIGAVVGLNLLQEYYGKKAAQQSIFISFMLLIFYAGASQLHLAYLPDATDTMHAPFTAILGIMPRLVIASLVVYLVVQIIETFMYGKLKHYYGDRYLVLRNCISISISQLIDTLLFSFLGLYGVIDNIWSIIIISYGIKLMALGITLPYIALSKKIINA